MSGSHIQPFVPTDYSNSPMDPERAKILQEAERAYVNGVPDEEGNIEWPTYRSLAADYSIPVRVINEQAAKHRWNANREQRRMQLTYFKQQQQMRQWQDMDREYTIQSTEASYKLQFVVGRKIEEMYQETVNAIGKDVDAASKGRRELNKSEVKLNDLKTLISAKRDLDEAQAARANRAQALPLGYENIPTPAELPTAVEEMAQLASSDAQSLTKIEDILRVIVDQQNRFDVSNDVIEGVVEDD